MRVPAGARRVSETIQQPKRRLIARDRDGDEAINALPPRAPGEQPQQAPTDAASLPFVDDGDGKLRCAGRDPDVASNADGYPCLHVDGDQRFVVAVVDVSQIVELEVGEGGSVSEEAPVARVVTQPLEDVGYERPVAGGNRSHEDPGTVGEP